MSSWTQKPKAHSLAHKFKRVPPNEPEPKPAATRPARRIEPARTIEPAIVWLVEPAPAPAPAPRPARPVVRLTKPLAPPPPAPAPPIPMSPALKARLQNAVDVLASKAGRRIDAHDKRQARKLLAAHPDKLSQLTDASKALEAEDEADLLD